MLQADPMSLGKLRDASAIFSFYLLAILGEERAPHPEAKICWLHSPTKLALNRPLGDGGVNGGRVPFR